MHQQLLLLQTLRFPARSLVAETPATVAFASISHFPARSPMRKNKQLRLVPALRPCPAHSLVADTLLLQPTCPPWSSTPSCGGNASNCCFCPHFAFPSTQCCGRHQVPLQPAFRPCRARSPVAETPATVASASISPCPGRSLVVNAPATVTSASISHFPERSLLADAQATVVFASISHFPARSPVRKHKQLRLVPALRPCSAHSPVAETPPTVLSASIHSAISSSSLSSSQF